MFYADDAVFMGQWSAKNIDTIIYVLKCFQHASGLHINLTKSKLMGLSVSEDRVEQAANRIGCGVLKALFAYLGSIVGGSMSRIKSWEEIVGKMTARLSKWKMKSLSIGGRLTLLKAVLGSMSIYHMSIFKVPMKVLHRMESIRCHFFNGIELNSKKSIWVKWSNVLSSKEKGGLDVSSLYVLNRALMFKWVWRFTTQKGSLWASVIKAIHGVDGKIGSGSKNGHKSIWRVIVQEMEAFKAQGVVLGVASDRWYWSLDGSGEFTVASVRKVIDDIRLPVVATQTRWIKAVPIKVNVHAWKVSLDCLPTRLNLSRRGIDIPSILCPICDRVTESSRHLFFECHFAKDIFRKICRWWNVDFLDVNSFDEWTSWIDNLRMPKMLLNNCCLVRRMMFVVQISASSVISKTVIVGYYGLL
ncbi:RNA-directed DNA polymerase, eukaryota, reverse transcriptase zinc-binding domain protein [Tanacetum coccineum]